MDRTLQAISGLYEAVSSGGLWQDALAAVCDAAGLSELCWVVWDKKAQAVLRIDSARRCIDGELFDRYCRDYVHVDPLRERLEQVASGTLINMSSDYPRDAWQANAYFQEFLLPIGCGHLGGSVVLDNEETMSGFGLHRDHRKDPFGPEDERFFRALIPHFQRISLIERRIGEATRAAAIAGAALDSLPFGLMVFDDGAQLAFCNEWLLEAARRRDGLAISRGQLATSDPALAAEFRSLVVRAIGSRASPGIGGSMVLPRASSPLGWLVVVMPVPPKSPLAMQGRPAALALFSDPAKRRPPKGTLLAKLFGLTPAEARLVLDLLDGASLRELAEMRGLSITTLRTQLSRVFAKTSTTRQSELVNLVASLKSF